MSKIKVKNFGPIQEGLLDDEGWLDIRKVTVFVGNQGSGKSTLAKLISTMTWLEKSLVREDFKEKDLMTYNRFKKHVLYQNIGSYFHDASVIEYEGTAYRICSMEAMLMSSKKKKTVILFPR